MCSDLGSTSRVCAFYSFTGILFTLFVGTLLSTQPEFVTGIEDVSEAKSNAFGAMGMFIATFALSLFGISRTRGDEKDNMDAAMEGYQLSGSVNQSDYGSSRYD
mmetsp:Transcript_6295/g.12745  ORF Transcript_6295/g.12745 Transcript_6295/m.12745 type:complete len:104 (-) Transcript_6295:568-879(-)|eukprot:CAMPEP_0171333464 /NCGR_PEP_ID=MMETSP0878-20121228/4031_1 /TAXON_ID=67004 /ORGANISM="Thalassiosira weissflogii, Strain CCMP1336" /LENGTH=103 /DNA_ID=CAMNT_0011834409 /DNA_START=185 /DNA_END=496 /DNA_ORIENTATION=-